MPLSAAVRIADVLARVSPTADSAHAVLAGETGRWLGMRPERAEAFLSGRVLVRELAGERVRAGANASVSYAGEYVAAAVSVKGEAAVGIDIEPTTRVLPRIIERTLCTPAERAALPMDPTQRSAELLELLTVKEAYAKALGAGLALGFTSISRKQIESTAGVRVDRTRTDELVMCVCTIEWAA